MAYYLDTQRNVHSLDSVEFEYLLPGGCVAISDSEADAIRNPPLTLEQQSALMEYAVQKHLDDTAKLRGYDSILSACSYAGAPNPFQAESQAYIQWRGNVWAYCYQVMAEVESGKRAIPTQEEIISELPVLVLP